MIDRMAGCGVSVKNPFIAKFLITLAEFSDDATGGYAPGFFVALFFRFPLSARVYRDTIIPPYNNIIIT